MSTERTPPGPSRLRRPPAPGPFVVGLVGPTGSGKSMIANALAADGARVLDADRLGHDVSERDPSVRAALAAEYGPDVYRADGTLDRKRVAAKVFTDPAALTRLNLLVHPRILERLRAGIAEAVRDGFTGVLVVDAALLLDWGFERQCDAVLAVLAPRARMVERLCRTRGWTEAEARQRLALVRGDDSFAALADEVVSNDGDEAAAIAAARAALARLVARRKGAVA